ncbi:MAG: HYR domain-containing protein, partial [Woeseiaceae bacterium]
AEELEITTISEPFNGEISAIAAPGQTLFFTRRVFGTPVELDNVTVSGFTTASQAANCSQTDRPPGNDDPYFCQLIEDQRERILLDTQPPEFGGLMDGDVIPIPFVQADRPGGACVDLVGDGSVTASDNGEPVAVSCTDSLGAAICTSSEPGQSIPVITLANPNPAPIVCTATDDAGNVGTVSLFVDVQDTQAPTFVDFPSTTIKVDADATTGTASLDFEAGLTAVDVDNVDEFPVISCTATTGQISGEPLPVGTTTVDCTVSDASGNMTTQSYTVQVNDVTPPEFINIPLPDFDVDATDPAGATVSYGIPDAADAGSGVTSIDCVPPPGTIFPIGFTTVTCTATDAAGNSASASFDVEVIDAVPPVVTVPVAGLDVEQQTPAGAVVDFSTLVSATDNIDPSPTLVCAPPSGGEFPPGTTIVTCTATDSPVGNTASAEFEVRVADTTDPVITVPTATLNVEQQTIDGATVVYDTLVFATDNIDASPAIVCTPASGTLFPAGLTVVTCTVTDSSGNTDSKSFNVTVTDMIAPVISVPAQVSAEQQGPSGAIVSYSATAIDNIDPAPGVSCSPASGSTFAPGSTAVNCIATDADGNSSAASFVVNVADTTDPVITVPAATISAEQSSPAGAIVNYTVTATDVADPAPAIACSLPSGSVFPAGVTTVTCTATDAAGNSASGNFDVVVADTMPPTLTVPAGGIDADLVSTAGANVDFSGAVTATDSADPSPSIVCEPPSGSLFPAGATSVSCTATDSGGNSASASFDVRVGYADGFGIDPKKLNVRGGSSNPLSWGWLDSNGAIIDTSADTQILEFQECGSTVPMFTVAGDPGSSGFRIKADNSWEYNWQSDGENGAPLDNGFYCVRVTSELTGQFLESPPIRVR